MSKELAQSKSSKCVDSLKAFFVDEFITALLYRLNETQKTAAEEIALWGDENGSAGSGLARLDDMVFVHHLAPEHSRFRFALAACSSIGPMRFSLR